jgi:hypothetical protein
MNITVNAETKIGALLDAHPEMEQVLIGISPEFRRLQNPILRRTVAKVATLAQAARIAGIPTPDLVKSLRKALGYDTGEGCAHQAPETAEVEPAWAATAVPIETLDAEEIMGSGGTPVGLLSTRLAKLQPGQIVALKAPFYPAPLVDAIRTKGHDVCVKPLDNGAFMVLVKA